MAFASERAGTGASIAQDAEAAPAAGKRTLVQQQGGIHLAGGVGRAGDAHEQHADAVADLVVQGKSAEGLLDRYAGRGAAPS